MSTVKEFPFGSPKKENFELHTNLNEKRVWNKPVKKHFTRAKKITTVPDLKKVKTPGLNASEQAIILPSLEYFSEPDSEGLNGAVTPDEIYSYITDMLINTINKVGHLPWQKEWTGSGSSNAAMNYASKKEYTGANFLLNFDIKFDENKEPYLVPVEFIQPYYLTFNQIVEAKAILKKDSKARRVIYYTMIFNYDSPTAKIKTSDKAKFNAFVKANGLTKQDLKINLKKIPVLKYYNVFRADDCTGLKFPKEKADKKQTNPIEEAQKIIDNYPNPPKYTFIGDKAYYRPSNDTLNMPSIEAFNSEAFYYSTFFHEMTHSTGAEKRLKRDFSGKFGDKSYAYEELIAELGAVFLCSESGILFHTRENSAKYLQSWNKKLVDELENDNRFFLKASAQAQKATNRILGREVANTETPVTPEKLVKKKVARVKKKSTQIELFSGLNAKPKKAVCQKKTIMTKAKEVKSDPKPVKTISHLDKNSLAYKMANQSKDVEYFTIQDKNISRLLGKIEKKTKDSVFISLTGGEGSMKTRMAFQFMNAFAQNYKVGHASIEEHPESVLYFDKAKQYLNQKAQENLFNPEINNLSSLHSLILKNDVIVIDSFTKMKEIEKSFEVDRDLRKKYNGKLFIVIFQQTTGGSMRGGSKSQFDADIVLFTEKFEDYKQNYVYATKNRYSLESGLKFNIYEKQLQGAKKEKGPGTEVQTKTKKLSFKVK
ncbi:zincin-like metallopeptidase domain-containing protein [Flavobacterium sp. 5]|uniref:zincin-like metallopeptidase domain-containing protein n=1 Tax=Flavobacterium sp. 5 TaxID=2035199 RepID=UPI000C2B548F|nr:zincin-like metallopeptidase domain-containing protein [Flavobacterium sp. 5]PKB18389.1 antirestriction protein ArdC [Flavobacterium sp. 5]